MLHALFIVLIFTTMSSSISFNDVFILDRYNISENILSSQIITVNYTALPSLQVEKTKYKNVNFNNSKLFNLIWNNGVNDSMSVTGISITQYFDKYYVYYSSTYKRGRGINFLARKPLSCNIKKCDIGWIFFVSEQKYYNFSHSETLDADYTILLSITSIDNKINLRTIETIDGNILLSICPYINWLPKTEVVKLIPEDDIKDNGYFIESNTFAHIITPIYYRTKEATFFVCGKLKQLQQPDIDVGFNLIKSNNSTELKSIDYVIDGEIKCNEQDDDGNYYHFGYTKMSENYKNKAIVNKIDFIKRSDYKLYAGQIIYIYKKEIFKKEMETNNITENLNSTIIEASPECELKVPDNLNVTIIPGFESFESVDYDLKNNAYIRFIKNGDMNNVFTLKCLSKIGDKYISYLDEFYSRYGEFTIHKDGDKKKEHLSSPSKIIFLPQDMDKFGRYYCKVNNKVSKYNEKLITFKKIYLIPEKEANFVIKNSMDKKNSLINCQKTYNLFAKIKKMEINFDGNGTQEVFNDFSQSVGQMSIDDNIINYNFSKSSNPIQLQCVYETIIGTEFKTTQEFERLYQKDKEILQVKSNKTMVIIIIVIVLITLVCVALITTIIIIKRKKAKKIVKINEISNYSLSSSTSASSSSFQLSKLIPNSTSDTKSINKNISKIPSKSKTKNILSNSSDISQTSGYKKK
uniref:Ig-like domain-containing protein n=1 Tax=Strongyloides stercoralis TaxID=6248 RepID=A0A913HXN7_STRER